ncbi:hypothetical protein BGX33_010435 [Mortierella sp. NVP41]|nr:hypothetical protein BGX33_010435 [Mortierella sp. NVP41]
MDSQHQKQHAWPVQAHPGAYMMTAPQMAAAQHQQAQAYPQHQQYQQHQQQHPSMMDQQQHPLGGHVSHHVPAPPGVPTHHQGYGMPPQEPPRGGPGNPAARRSPPPYTRPAYRERSYSPPPRHRRTPSPRGYRESRGYERDMGGQYGGRFDRGYDRGYDRSDRGGGYDRGYDRGGYDRGYDRGGYDRGYGGGGYRGYDRGGYGRPRSPPRRSRTINRGTEEDRSASKTLYVGNIPYSFREPEVEEMFKKFGTIVKITVVLDQYTGRNKGFAFVEYENRKDAEEALEKYNGFDVEGRRLKLDWDIGLGKKDIKPPRSSTGTTAENSTAETSPQPQTHSTTEASTPAEGEVQKSDESTPVIPSAENQIAASAADVAAANAATAEVATDIAATHLDETKQSPSTDIPSTTTTEQQHTDGSAEAPLTL